MKLRALLLTACIAVPALPGPARAGVAFNDVLDAPPEVLDVIETTLWEMVHELGLADEVIDMAIVGSFAHGTARPWDSDERSDLDVVIYMRSLSRQPEGYYDGFKRFREASMRWAPIITRRADLELDVDLKVNTRDVAELIADPDWVGYSLIQRRIYNRAAGAVRNVRGHFHDGVYYLLDRDAYTAFLRQLNRQPRRITIQAEGDRIVFLDREALAHGERVELLWSLPKRGLQRLRGIADGTVRIPGLR